ncbi:SAV_2336 N-terminal domain-related protein [Streptomyces sp. NPDC017546]|uniref:SAV_2336 N-terminal domain-related protein n=1 Tax=Streptomyces sp. NPDC017546 TaxID=3365001 RepID=UPI0037B87C7E
MSPQDDALARSMAELLAGAGPPSAEEVADVLWMARAISRAAPGEESGESRSGRAARYGVETDTGASSGGTDGERVSEGTRSTDRVLPHRPAPAGGDQGQTEGGEGLSSSAPDVPLHPVSTGTTGRSSTENGPLVSGGPGAVVRAPREPALSDSLAIARALRPLKRRVETSGARVLDEAATATATGEASLLVPAWLPRTERWLSVDLVVDTGPSMVIWHQLAAELRTLLEGQGAFRTVRAWSLESGETEPRLSTFRRATGVRPKRVMPWEQLTDPTGRHLLLLLTDGVGPLWRRDGMRAALRQWSRDRPVAVLQVLPRSLWHRTGLAPMPVLARPAPHGRSTPLFRGGSRVRGTPPAPRSGGWVPVLELDAEWIAPWAQVVSGRAAGWTPLLALPTDGPEADTGALSEAYDTASGELSAAALIERFRGEASQSAFELAGYFAAAPLVMPVMRLVQRVMMPGSRPSHLAEVFLSGLLRRADGTAPAPAPGEDPDLTLYDFSPGVREVLLNTLTRQESLRTLDVVSQVSGRVAQRLGGSLNFRALVPSADARGTWRLPEESLPFARVAATVLAGLDGDHRAAAAALTSQIDAVSSHAASPVAAPPRPVAPRPVPPRPGDEHRATHPSSSSRLLRTPMLFVGLGGTGGLVGAELERKLRVDLCGPDGTALQHIGGLAPYQLPDCLQFVYADFSESDLLRLPQFNVDFSLRAAYARTSRATHNLLPNFDSSPEVTQMLRASLREEVAGWLPPREGEPVVTPLHNGAGQLPTVGRAALFATLRHSLQPVLEPLLQAIDAIAKSAGELSELGGGRVTGCDVFVAFSVAGGTGAGIFLDYLHLINQAFKMRDFNGVKIYPLVVMPSAFPPEAGGGREAELNAARSLVDLFRLVDGQNAPTAGAEIGELDQETGLGIRYPGTTPVRLRTGILPTAFLFSPTAGIRQDDLRRSIVSLVMSLIGTELGDSRSQGRPMAGDDDFQTFAASFINRGVHRSALSPTGIGRQGVSTSLAASMTAPMDQLADLVAGRLLRVAVTELAERPRNLAESEATLLIRQLFVDSGLEELWERKQLPVEDPQPLPRGGKAIEEALNNRLGDMQRLLSELQSIADRQAAAMAARFSPRPAIEKLLRSVGPFLAENLVRGDPGSGMRIPHSGFLGMLADRARPPQPPPDVTDQPPWVPRIKDRIAGISPARWGGDDVQAALRAQDAWYRWRSETAWHEAWRKLHETWQPQADAAGTEIRRLVLALRKHAGHERKSSQQKSMELYAERTGISYLLPPQHSLNHFYEDVVARLIRREELREGDDEAALLLRACGDGGWRSALAQSHRNPEGAVTDVRALLAGRIMRVLTENGGVAESSPLLPSVGLMLAAAAGEPDAAARVSVQALELFDRKLAGLLPVGFTPEGTGRLQVLVTHPRVPAAEEAREYLHRALRLPSDPMVSVQFWGVESDSITVVLVRSEMSLTEVPEARKVLRQWARAQDDEQAHDVLRWRQRLGFEDDWMVSSEEDQRTILHRLLCCMWNGQVDILDGDTASPSRVRLRLFPEKGAGVPGLRLRLRDFPGGISSWSELLRSYERWTVLDDERTVEDYCRMLMSARPLGLGRLGSEPHPLFLELVERVAPDQLGVLEEHRAFGGRRDIDWIQPLYKFWAETLPAALDMEFSDQRAIQPTLRALLEHRGLRGDAPRFPSSPGPARGRTTHDEEGWGPTASGTDERRG